MSTVTTEFKIQAYRLKELRSFYGATWKTWIKWMEEIPDLGDYKGKLYTPAQVEKIVKFIGRP